LRPRTHTQTHIRWRMGIGDGEEHKLFRNESREKTKAGGWGEERRY
jgi:hypothetical protein